MALITSSEIENELKTRNYFAVPSGQTVPPQDNNIPSTPGEQLLSGLNLKILLLVAFGVMVILFE